MIVPPFDDRGDLVADWTDERIPGHVPGRFGDLEVHPVGHAYGDSCERHLFDVLERSCDDESDVGEDVSDDAYAAAVREREAGWYPMRFDARFVCVRCGHVEAWRGKRQTRTFRQLDVEPVVAGTLRAQQVGGGDYPTFTIYNAAGDRVGALSWARGPRGRRYYDGRLGTVLGSDDDPRADGDTPLAVLRKLAKIHAARTADALSVVDLTPGTTP